MGRCIFSCIHANFAIFHKSIQSLSGSECNFPLSAVSVSSLMGPVETPQYAVPFTPLQAPDFVEFVLLVLQSESCFLLQEDDAPSLSSLQK